MDCILSSKFVIFAISLVLISSLQSDINISNILSHYIRVCGVDYFCNKSIISIDTKPDLSYKSLNLCPDCSCDEFCLKNGTCCPDLFFTLPEMMCDSLYILEPPNEKLKINSSDFQIVSSCPINSNGSLNDLCIRSDRDDLVKEIVNIPVTGTGMNIAYRNKYCAHCNSEYDVTEWNLDIDCELFADFNYFSTYDEIVEEAIIKRCGIRYIPGSLPVHLCPKESESESQIIDRCNVTGHWLKYDVDIATACESAYDLRFRIFKNVFCYMCNPSKYYIQTPISFCNTTDLWQPNDEGLRKSCKFYIEVDGSKPYKNVFCYLCNRDNDDIGLYLDVTVELHEKKPNLTTNVYEYDIRPEFYKRKYFSNVVSERTDGDFTLVKGQSWTTNGRLLPDGRFINITSLIRSHFAHGGKYQYCHSRFIDPNKWFLPVFQHICECEPYFLFKNKHLKPCISISLRYPSQCQSNQVFTKMKYRQDETTYLVTKGCFRHESLKILKRNCETKEASNILNTIPVALEDGSEVYGNIFCNMCNNFVTDINYIYGYDPEVRGNINPGFGKPFDVHISCRNVLDYSHYVTLYAVLKNARQMGCTIVFVPKENANIQRYCKAVNHWEIRKCNETGQWTDYDRDVEWACEESDHDLIPHFVTKHFRFLKFYRNAFCRICNPDYANETIITKCNVTGKWEMYTPTLERACAVFPRVDTLFPYKNVFCKLCNGGLPDDDPKLRSTPAPPAISTKRPVTEYLLTFRSIFSLKQVDEGSIEGDPKAMCRVYQIYDAYKAACRNVTCYPGKRVVNDSCSPLLRITSKLRYIITFGMKGQVNGNRSSFGNITYRHIVYEFKISLMKFLNQSLMTNAGFDSYFALGDKNCNVQLTTNVNILVNFNLFISGFVDRVEAERSLLSLGDGVLKVNLYGVHLTSYRTKSAFYLPLLVSKADLSDKCLETYSDYRYHPHEHFKSTFVDKVMLCKQVEIESHEFEFDTINILLKFRHSKTQLEYNDYKILSNGNARVCIDFIQSELSPTDDKTMAALSMITVVCVGMSLFCLFFTFITYCIFSSLRTLPGKNLMLLIFTILCTQICFMAGFRKITTPWLCITRGILSHLFWLSSFCCMVSSTFHMYRVFVASKFVVVSLQEGNKMFCKYAACSYFIPVLVIVVNLAVHLIVSRGTNTGYNGSHCLLEDKTSLVAAFLVPISCTCIVNIILFIMVSLHIYKAPKVQSSNKTERRDFLIFLKIFTTTGILFILQIIDSFVPLSVFSFIVTILIGLQGLFIFISYICNARVFNMYKDVFYEHKCCKGKTHSIILSSSSGNVDRSDKKSVEENYGTKL